MADEGQKDSEARYHTPDETAVIRGSVEDGTIGAWNFVSVEPDFESGRWGGGKNVWDILRDKPESVDPEFRHLVGDFLKDIYGLNVSPQNVLDNLTRLRDQILSLKDPVEAARLKLENEGKDFSLDGFLTEKLSALNEEEKKLKLERKRLSFDKFLTKRILESEHSLSLVKRVLDPENNITIISDKEAEKFLGELRDELEKKSKKGRKTIHLKTKIGGARLFFGSGQREFLEGIAGKTVPEFKEFLADVQEKKRQENLEEIFWDYLEKDYLEWWNLKEEKKPKKASAVRSQVMVGKKKKETQKPKTVEPEKPEQPEPAKRRVGEILLTLPPDIVFEPRIPKSEEEKLAEEEKGRIEKWLSVWRRGVREIRINPDKDGKKIARIFLLGKDFAWVDFSLLCRGFVWPDDSGFRPDMEPEELKNWLISRIDRICFLPYVNNPEAIIKVVPLPERAAIPVPVTRFVREKTKVPVAS